MYYFLFKNIISKDSLFFSWLTLKSLYPFFYYPIDRKWFVKFSFLLRTHKISYKFYPVLKLDRSKRFIHVYTLLQHSFFIFLYPLFDKRYFFSKEKLIYYFW